MLVKLSVKFNFINFCMRIGSFGDKGPDKIDERKRDQQLDVLSDKLLNLFFWNVLNVSRSRADVVSIVLEFR